MPEIFRPKVKGVVATGGGASADWETVGVDFTQRCASIAIWGETSSGKTTLALTSKGPVGLLHASEKVAGIVEPHVRKGKVVRKFDFGFAVRKGEEEGQIAERARGVWAKWMALYTDGMTKWAGTIIVDTEPDAWMLRRLARFGTLTPKGDLRDLYGAVNFDWSQIFKNTPREQAETRGANLITIHTASDAYKDVMVPGTGGGPPKKVSIKTGEYKMDGQKSIRYWADVILWVDKDPSGQYTVRIDKGWFNGQIEGSVLDDTMMRNLGYTVNPAIGSALTIPSILALITETPEEEWM